MTNGFRMPKKDPGDYMGKYAHGFEQHMDIIHQSKFDLVPYAEIIQGKKFPDISFYQGEPNFDILASKTDAVIIRAGQGNWADTQVERNIVEAIDRHLVWGVYWFYDDRYSPGNQVKKLVEVLKGRKPPMGIWWDWEKLYGGQYSGIRQVVAAMEETERQLPGTHVGIYTGYYWFREHSNPNDHAGQYNYLKDKMLWLPWWTEYPEHVLVPAPWSFLTLWQYGTPAIGPEYGVNTQEIDMNHFNGTDEQFQELFGGEDLPPPDDKTWIGTMLRKMPVYLQMSLNPPKIRAMIKKGLTRTGKLRTTADGITWLEFNENRFIPVRQKDLVTGETLWKYVSLEEVPTDPPE